MSDESSLIVWRLLARTDPRLWGAIHNSVPELGREQLYRINGDTTALAKKEWHKKLEVPGREMNFVIGLLHSSDESPAVIVKKSRSHQLSGYIHFSYGRLHSTCDHTAALFGNKRIFVAHYNNGALSNMDSMRGALYYGDRTRYVRVWADGGAVQKIVIKEIELDSAVVEYVYDRGVIKRKNWRLRTAFPDVDDYMFIEAAEFARAARAVEAAVIETPPICDHRLKLMITALTSALCNPIILTKIWLLELLNFGRVFLDDSPR